MKNSVGVEGSRASPCPTKALLGNCQHQAQKTYAMTDQTESANSALSGADTERTLFEPTLPSPNVPMTKIGNAEADREAVQDDAWLDNWDLIIHRCSDCGRPFGTANRLTQHRAAWHSLDSPKLPPYEHQPVIPHIEKSNLYVLVDDGDLFVKALSSSSPKRSSRCVFQVNSQILWAVSSVFRAMLGPKSSFKEALEIRRAVIRGSNSPVPIITLDGPPAIVLLVLQILCHRHAHPQPLPETISISGLSRIAAFADKYELCDVLLPWARRWRWNGLVKLPCEDAGYKVFISWVFGMEDEFAEASSAASISMYWSLEAGLYLRDKGPDGPVWEFKETKHRANSALPEETTEKIISTLAPKFARLLHSNRM